MRFAKTASPDEVGWMPSLQGRTPVWRKKLNAFAYRFECLGKCLFLKGILWRMACANAFWRYAHGRCARPCAARPRKGLQPATPATPVTPTCQ